MLQPELEAVWGEPELLEVEGDSMQLGLFPMGEGARLKRMPEEVVQPEMVGDQTAEVVEHREVTMEPLVRNMIREAAGGILHQETVGMVRAEDLVQ
jgi:hypothetical protein